MKFPLFFGKVESLRGRPRIYRVMKNSMSLQIEVFCNSRSGL